jgi:hypothetical protein
MFPKWSDWDISYTRQGTLKKRRKVFLRSLVFLALFSGALRLGWTGQNWTSIKPRLKSYLKNVLLAGASTIQTIGASL